MLNISNNEDDNVNANINNHNDNNSKVHAEQARRRLAEAAGCCKFAMLYYMIWSVYYIIL